jgi:hypothetical protein
VKLLYWLRPLRHKKHSKERTLQTQTENSITQPLSSEKRAAPLKDRVTVVDMVYHQPANASPSTALGEGSRFYRELHTHEQVYQRNKVATNEWLTVDTGWLESCSMLILQNNEGKFSYRPTPERLEEVKSRVIELSFDKGKTVSIVIPPGESCRFSPNNVNQISIRCRNLTATYTLCLIPE